jgi:hypothetical protein
MKRVTALLSSARSNADDTLAAFPAVGLIFRGPLQQIQTQSHFAAETRNIPELGISEFKARWVPLLPRESAKKTFKGSVHAPARNCQLVEKTGIDKVLPSNIRYRGIFIFTYNGSR